MDWNAKRVVVTGAAGVIGRELINRLTALDARVLAVDILPNPNGQPGVDVIQADLRDGPPAAMDVFDPEVIFHLAATFERIEESPGVMDSNLNDNVILSHNLLSALQRYSSLEIFVFPSSYLIYDGSLYLASGNGRGLKESDRINPRNLVGLGKYFTERELDFLRNIGTRYRSVSARIFRVYGCGSRDVISRWVRSIIRDEPIEVYGGTNRFDFIYAADVARGLIAFADSPAAQGIINLGSGISRSIDDVVSILHANLPATKVKQLQREVTGEASCADLTLMGQLTNFGLETSLEDGIQRIISYEMTNHKRA